MLLYFRDALVTPFSLPGVDAEPLCDETSKLVDGIKSMTFNETSTKKMGQSDTFVPRVPAQSRESLDHHFSYNDFMNDLHGQSPADSELKPVRPSLGKPPRFSTSSAVSAVVEPGQQFQNLDNFAT